MKATHHLRRLAPALLLLTVGAATAEESALQRIMADLANHLYHLNRAIYTEDFAAIGQHAQAIAKNPQPPFLEKVRLLATLGSAAPRFKAANETMQTAATEVVAAAERGDLEAVRTQVAQMESGCLECHSAYRQQVAVPEAPGG